MTSPPQAKERGPRFAQKLWVPVVLIVGFLLGELIYTIIITEQSPYTGGRQGPPFGFPYGPNHFPYFERDPSFQFHVVLTTLEVALLVALVAVYARMYVQTKASFSLGLVVFLGALLIQALLSYPILLGFIGPIYLGPGLTSEFADVVTVCAYTVFLYLSLE
jgi:hypothetical protein